MGIKKVKMEIIKKYLRKVKPLVEVYRMLKKKDELTDLMGMTSVDERLYYEKYSSVLFSGDGAIVDLGCWFGSTTISLAKGLKANNKVGKSSKKIYAYDQFLWEEWMIPFVSDTKWKNYFKPGDSFLIAFEEKIKKYKSFIVTRQADLTKEEWHDGQIEYLLVDAMKSWELLNSIQKNFYPSLIPGKSIVLHQDFVHYYTYWIHLLNFRLKEYFELADLRNYGCSLAFLLIKSIPSHILSKTYSLNDFSIEDIEAAFEYSLSLVLPESRGAIMAAKIMCYKDKEGDEVARTLLTKVKAEGFQHFDIETVSKILK